MERFGPQTARLAAVSRGGAAVVQILDIITEPQLAFRRIQAGRLNPWILGACILALTMTVQYYEAHRVFDAISASAAASGPKMFAAVARAQMIYLLAQPVVLVAKWLLIAFLLWTGLLLATREARFVDLMVLTLSAQAIQVLHQSCVLIIALVRGDDARRGLTDVGVNLLIDSGSRVLHDVAALCNPFSVWYLALLLYGVAHLSSTSPRRSIPALAPYGVLTLLVVVGAAVIRPAAA